MLGIVSSCALLTLSLRRAVFPAFDFKKCRNPGQRSLKVIEMKVVRMLDLSTTCFNDIHASDNDDTAELHLQCRRGLALSSSVLLIESVVEREIVSRTPSSSETLYPQWNKPAEVC